MTNKISAYISLIRPINFFITAIVVIVSGIISSLIEINWLQLILAGISAGLTAAAGNVINDFCDIDIDKIVHKKRPLVTGRISRKEALVFYTFLLLASALISYFISLQLLAIVTLASLLLFLYSYKLRRFLLIGNIVISFLTGLAFIYGGVAVGNPNLAVVPAAFAFLINLIREIIKDIEDKEGDLEKGLISFPIRFGIKKSKIFIAIISLVLFLSTMFPFFYHYYRIEYFIIVMLVVNPIIVLINKKLFTNDSTKNLHRISSLLKLNMLVGLIAIFLGK